MLSSTTAPLVCLILLIGYNTGNAFDARAAKERVVEFRVRSQLLHIEHIEKQLEKLEKEFDGLSPPVEQSAVEAVKTRIHKLEGNECGANHVPCGAERTQCVHRLLFCDGTKDCRNGHDEDKHVCSGDIVKAGSSFTGFSVATGCIISVNMFGTSVVTSSHRSPFFGARTIVRMFGTGQLRADQPPLMAVTSTGYYEHATRQLVLSVDDEKLMGTSGTLICTFNQGDDDRAYCRGMLESSQRECSHMLLLRA